MSKRQRNRRAKRLRHAPVAGLVVGAALAAPALAQADMLTVTSTDDAGAGTLRQAILDSEAVAHPGADDIVFDPAVTGPIHLASALPTVTQPLTITDATPDSSPVAIDGTGINASILTLNMTNTGDAVSISGLTLTNGGAGNASGGAIRDSNAALTIRSSILSGNHAAVGGAIYQGPGKGSVTVDSTTLSGNHADFPGGAIDGHDVTVENGSKVTGNYAAGDGGGVRSFGVLTVRASEVSGNTSGIFGGGLYATGTTTPGSSVTITDSTVSDNHAAYGGGATTGYISGSIERSTFAGNTATGKGGGIDLSSAPLTISNSTITGNSADKGGGGVFHYTYSPTDRPVIDSSTIAGNDGGAAGGGIFVYAKDGSDLPVALSNSIVADNSMTSGDPADLGVSAGTAPIPAAFSLIQDAPGTALTDSGHNIIGQPPHLGSLAENGGATKTMALEASSPALDSGSTSLATDQRGLPRASGRAPDMGAFERQVTVPPVAITAPAPAQPQPGAVVKVGKFKAGKSSVTVSVSCASAACSGNVSLNAIEKLNGKQVVGLAKRLKTKKVKVGSKGYALAAGQTRTVTVKLNRRGRKLLTKYRKMKVRVSVAQHKATRFQVVKTGKVTLKKKR